MKNTQTRVALAVLVAALVVLAVWRMAPPAAGTVATAEAVPPVMRQPSTVPKPEPERISVEPEPAAVTAPQKGADLVTQWPNTEVVNQLRDVDANAASVRAAIAKARPVLGVDQDAQLLVGGLLIGHGDLIDGLAWLLLACMDCTQADERIGYGCAAEGFCDPNLAYIHVLRRDFGEQAVADALVRMEEIKTTLASGDPAALAPFTEVADNRFPRDVGECVQLRTPTPECPPEEILRQTEAAYQ